MTNTPPPPPPAAHESAPDKRRTLLELLDRDEGLVALHLDARHPGVAVPPHLLGELALRLDIAYGFNLPRLEIDDEGVEAVLSFGGRNFACFLPWDAIFALSRPRHDGEGFVWPASLPPELRAPLGGASVDAPPAPPAPGSETAPPDTRRDPLVTIPPQAEASRPAPTPPASLAPRASAAPGSDEVLPPLAAQLTSLKERTESVESLRRLGEVARHAPRPPRPKLTLAPTSADAQASRTPADDEAPSKPQARRPPALRLIRGRGE